MSNILITAISPFGKNFNEQSEYSFETGAVYTGRISSEPGVREACDYFRNQGEHLDSAILITTSQVNAVNKAKIIDNESVTPTQYIEKLIHKLEPSCSVIPILFDNHNSGNMIVDILQSQKFYPHDQIICDISGGLRAGMMNMMLLLYFLRYEGIEIAQIISAERQEDNETILKNHTEFNQMIDMINALNSFTSHGDSEQLEKILTNQCEGNWADLTSAIHTFSENIIQANPGKISNNLSRINQILSQPVSEPSDSFTDEMITEGGIPAIRTKLHLNDSHDVIDTIYWCLENNMMLQALSIYNEQIPVYLIKQKKLIIPGKAALKKAKPQKGKNSCEILMYNVIGNLWRDMMTTVVKELFPDKTNGEGAEKVYTTNIASYDQVITVISEYQEKYALNDDVCLRMTAHIIFFLNLVREKNYFGAVTDDSITTTDSKVWKQLNFLRNGNFIHDLDWKSEQIEIGDNLYHQLAESNDIHFKKPDGFSTVFDDYLAIRLIRNLSIHTGEESITGKVRRKYGDLFELNLDRNIAFVKQALEHLSDYVKQ